MNSNSQNYVINEDGESIVIELNVGFIVDALKNSANEYYQMYGKNEDPLYKTTANMFEKLADEINVKACIQNGYYKSRKKNNELS